MTDETNITNVLVSQMEFLREDVRELSIKLDKANENKVSHREWAMRNEHVNNRMASLGREINDLRVMIQAKSAPWWSVGALIVSAGALLWTMFRP